MFNVTFPALFDVYETGGGRADRTTMTEKKLQESVAKLLYWRGVNFFRSRMDKATTNEIGTPDFLFAVDASGMRVVACAWECKLPGKTLSEDQEAMRKKLEKPPNRWRYKIITSLDQAIRELEEIGL